MRHLMGVRPWAYWGSALLWWAFFLLPLAVGLVLERLFDAIPADGPALALLAAVAGLELTRVALLPLVASVFEPFWATAETALRTNVLRAQLAADPDQRGPAVASPAAALPLFRDDPEHVAQAVDTWIDLTGAVMLGGIALVVLARIDLAVAVAVAVPLVAATAISTLLAPLVRRRRHEDRVVTARVTGFLGEVFGAVTTLTAAGASPAVLRRLRELCDQRRRTAVRDRVAEQLLSTVGQGAGDVALAAGLFIAAVAVADELTPGQVALLASYALLLGAVPRNWARWVAHRRHADVAVDRLRAALPAGDLDALVAPVAWVHLDPPQVARDPAPTAVPAPRLTLDRVVVRAPDGQLIGPITAQVPAGGFAVITGAVGVGKSTLARALVGLAPLVSGLVRWDGEAIDPARRPGPPRASYVAQVPTLFSERLEDNLRLGWEVADADLRRALEAAAFDDLERTLEDGLATRLGPRGVRLSGGQAHRVATARALVTRSALLVADDLSAALDAGTEARLLDGLLASGDRTIVAVSHRPTVLARADVVVDLGSVAGRAPAP